MLDHSQCVVVTTPQWEEHTCPPCPHGLVRGYTITLTGSPRTDNMQRELKLHAMDTVLCSHPYHAKALAHEKGR